MNSKKLHLSWILAAAAVVVLVVALRPGGFAFPSLLIALVCPAMMFFMMRGMHHGAGDQSQDHQACHGHEEHPDDAEVMPK
jgi:type III secretory pathway component EscV